VRAIDVDPDMIAVLHARPDLAAADVVLADALAYDYGAIEAERWCACGNLPYNIATPLLGRWLDLERPPERIVVMVQRDVADRLTAKPGSKTYGSLSVLLALTMDVRRAFVLGPAAFYPRPRVQSAVVTMDRLASPAVTVPDRRRFMQVVRAGFAYRRKTLANSLSLALGIPREQTQRSLAQLGLDTEIRAEYVDLAGFAALAHDLVT
jgi:16S rRNA (adenine1518-N6/adenine1519-N6)-dimethyltransferase